MNEDYQKQSELTFIAQLRAVRSQSLALSQQHLALAEAIDVLLELAERPTTGSNPEQEECTHPIAFRQPAGTMRKPNQTFCGRCNQTVEG